MDAMNEINSLVSQVIPSHSAKSHDFSDLFGKCVSLVVYAHFFLSDKKCILLKYVHMFFLCAFLEFMHILVFLIQDFCYAIFQNAHKNRWLEMQL